MSSIEGAAITAVRIEGVSHEFSSIGGVVELHIKELPAGLGDPVFEKIDAELAHGLMSIGAIKGIEFGDGFKVAEKKGSETNDLFHVSEKKRIEPKTNHSGGVLGGISTGQDFVLRLAVKAPSSIKKEQKTVDNQGNEVLLSTEGRHDPCICPRVVPVAEAMAALVVLDLILVQNSIANKNDIMENAKDMLTNVDTQLLLLLKRRQQLEADIKKMGSSSKSLDGHLQSELKKISRELGLDEAKMIEVWNKIIELS